MDHPTPLPKEDGQVQVLFISLGCAKNQVDSEIMLHLLEKKGFVLTDREEEAQVVVINTCSFIESAVEESIETILEAARLKEEGQCRVLVVTGCFPQRYQRTLISELPEVDLFLGTESFVSLPDRLLEFLRGRRSGEKLFLEAGGTDLWGRVMPRRLFGTPGTAYLKIAEGCSNRCSYCTIPSIRGPLRSRPPEVVLAEARLMAEQGVKELILVAQDSTAYGTDRGRKSALPELLQRLTAEAGCEWIRLLYLRPERITPELLRVMADSKRVCPYFDLPLQHINERILKAMNRPYGRKEVETIIREIRQILPQATLRTTMMVGFPGETEVEFQELLDFICETEFDHLGGFVYSPEEGPLRPNCLGGCRKRWGKNDWRSLWNVKGGSRPARTKTESER